MAKTVKTEHNCQINQNSQNFISAQKGHNYESDQKVETDYTVKTVNIVGIVKL